MTPEISEFSYGFALTNELVGWTAFKTAPIFPSHIEEGKKGGGYDVALDLPAAPLYLQFKRSDCMTRRSAREISQYKLNLDLPLYRFGIADPKRSFQHTSLVALDNGHNLVFYAAPRFHTLSEINQVWTGKMVMQCSIFIEPKQIGLIDDDDWHHVSFDSHRAFFCSEPRDLAEASIDDLRQRLEARFIEDDRPLRTILAEWRGSVSSAAARAREMQAELYARMETRGPEEELLVPRAFRYPLEIPPPQEEDIPAPRGAEIRPERQLDENKEALRALSDEARRTFNTQLVVVQPRVSQEG